MKTKKILLLTAALSVKLSFAQFAKVVDKEGYVNVRENADAKSNIIGKINSDEIVYVFESDPANKNWANVSNGYIHNSRLKYIQTYQAVPPTVRDGNKAIFKSENIKVNIVSGKFNFKENEKDFTSTLYGDFYKEQQVWGIDGTIPKTHYLSITAQIGNKTVQIPAKDIENLFEVNNKSTTCYYDRSNDTLYISMLNSDGAGSYVALFTIEKGEYKGRTLEMPF
ncbi:SH3 domain-containing protein [Chryseobacterium indologenes]|uniref:SH3 domain-containing protein n=1 Tax=Chryseobacterium TaxID=59732 RepID=UPI001628DE27|nr:MULTISPECIES: SH3 domain-containing protein [Chryseobacterium]MDM1555757.1 SH3 domain-containing protein [Chryseobacterium indologenes]WET51151.1 SH3 domain-containing protein [Chryseobacterium indologenes]